MKHVENEENFCENITGGLDVGTTQNSINCALEYHLDSKENEHIFCKNIRECLDVGKAQISFNYALKCRLAQNYIDQLMK